MRSCAPHLRLRDDVRAYARLRLRQRGCVPVVPARGVGERMGGCIVLAWPVAGQGAT
ncbi:hypothetical protein HOR13_gp01 [Xanthomonas phage XAJ24]|uniref:Uncharacterized protein n=1 Tax=Xanthomonas phage XAJ24 TaxID=1775250 RepID=A0A1I9L2C7_9CAUD|nr:hypothetical protein HOR13_gp01 [Xanthomonas phage XAJ24]AMW36114.1 hypothetical protein [Xanthomonas phage XAJ24]